MAVAEAGAHSQFDVVVDGSVVFSKQREGRFPETDEILAHL
jgi:predicted Rdx family selenoprotein